MFSAHNKKQTTMNYRKKMSKPATGNNYGTFKYQDTRYMKWLKDELDRRETKDKLISWRNDIVEANKRVNYRNQIDRMNNENSKGQPHTQLIRTSKSSNKSV